MIFSVSKKEIADKLQHLINMIPSKASMMILSHFRIDADSESNLVTIIATDLNITAIVKITANVVANGTLLVSAKHLSDIINALPDTLINFSQNDDHLVIECVNSSFSISVIESSLFPEISFIEDEKECTFNAQKFKKIVQNTTFCAATEGTQSICNGVYFKIEENLITIAATDTKRIGESKLRANFSINEPYEIVLPPKALNFIEKNITSDIDEITIKYDERRVSFYLKNIMLISNKFEGKYPHYVVGFRHLPEAGLLIDKNTIRDAIKRVSLLSEDNYKLIKIVIQNEELIIESVVSERGNAKEYITGFKYDGPDITFCINSRLLSSIIGVIESDEVLLKIKSNFEPIWILNNIDFEDLEIRFVLMPSKCNE